MDKLLANGLQFGKLLHVDQPNLVSRYNAALEAMGLPPTKLTNFYIDACGFSPEIADELDMPHYLDPHGVNRRFIILTPEQRKLPLLNINFSADVNILKQFYTENDKSIRTITLKDAIYGEIENMIFEVNSIEDLISISEVSFIVHTPSEILESAFELKKDIEHFHNDKNSWKDELLIEHIVIGAKKCGDIRSNGLIPSKHHFSWPSVFRTTHYGGIYIIKNDGKNFILGREEVKETCSTCTSKKDTFFFALNDAQSIWNLLQDHGYMEPLNIDWLIDSNVLERRLQLVVAEILSINDPSFNPMKMLDDPYSNKWIHTHLEILKKDQRFSSISQMRQIIGNDGDALQFESSLPPHLKMLFRRAIPDHPDAWDINRIVLQWNNYDIISLYALDKPNFYHHYMTMASKLQDFAIEYLLRNYHVNGPDIWRRKAGFRESMFGIHQI